MPVIIGIFSLMAFFTCLIGATNGERQHRPTAFMTAALYLIAAAIAFK